MNHRERVETALNREVPDRCPMQISFTPEFATRLRRAMGLVRDEDHNPHGGGNPYDLEIALGEDVLITSAGWANSYYHANESYRDEWGVHWNPVAYETPYGKGHYTEMTGHPLAEDDAVSSYQMPDPHRPELYRSAERMVGEYKDSHWIVGAAVTTIFETAWALRGLERLMMDFVENPDLAEEILELPHCYHREAAKKLTELGVDMVWLGDDFGMQSGMMISPDLWRKFFKARMAGIIASLKTVNPDIKVAYHSDGDIRPIIPDLIEIGVEVLNPIQPACMDPAEIKRRYGDRLCFWGSIDEQHTLPFSDPGGVAGEVASRLETIGKGGGLIIGPTHHVQLDTPMENFWAMVNTIKNTPCRA